MVYFTRLPKEIVNEILFNLHLEDIINICNTDKDMHLICDNVFC